MKTKSIFSVLLSAVILASCVSMPNSMTTEMPTSISVSVLTQAPPPPTAKIERWVEYQNALATAFIPSTPGLCEWELLGQTENEVYVWAICQEADSSNGAAMSAPAVIYLSKNNSIERVEIPGDGSMYSVDIREMFPKDLQAKILSNSIDSLQEMWSHIQIRRENPEPPLVIMSGVFLP